MEKFPTTEHDPSSVQEREPLNGAISQEMGRVALFRIMNLEGHTGVSSSENGVTEYTVQNTQYENQGDFAYHGDDAFEKAVDRAYPNKLDSVYQLFADEADVVEADPAYNPGVSYVKNGAKVEARKVPAAVVDAQIDRIMKGAAPLTSHEVLQQLNNDIEQS